MRKISYAAAYDSRSHGDSKLFYAYCKQEGLDMHGSPIEELYRAEQSDVPSPNQLLEEIGETEEAGEGDASASQQRANPSPSVGDYRSEESQAATSGRESGVPVGRAKGGQGGETPMQYATSAASCPLDLVAEFCAPITDDEDINAAA